MKWYRLAAEKGDEKAQLLLATMYDSGTDVEQNYEEAAKWYQMAAEQGVALAQSNLGDMYYQGQGVTPDYVRAYLWFHLAGESGRKADREKRDLIEQRMTTDQIAEAKKLAREWINKHKPK